VTAAIELREATLADAEMVFEWRNDPTIVALGTTRLPVGWDEHLAWFRATVDGDERLLLLVQVDGRPAGQVRFDRASDGAVVVSIYLLAPFRGRGIGTQALRAACARALMHASAVIAFVRDDNAASLAAFAGAGFQPANDVEAPPHHVALRLRGLDFAGVREFFDERARRERDTVAALDYGSEGSQRARFAAIVESVELDGRSLLDVGCGLAHLADFLDERGLHVRYTGLDISPAMVARARRRRADLDLRAGNVLDSPLDDHDVVCANGIFYLHGAAGGHVLERVVERMWQLAREAVVFTSLSAWAPPGEEGEFHAEPLETLAFCRRLTSRIAFRHDYLPHDFLVVLRR
jgi:RimJ/RimL family protein N-acetyltransferase